MVCFAVVLLNIFARRPVRFLVFGAPTLQQAARCRIFARTQYNWIFIEMGMTVPVYLCITAKG